MSTVLTHRVLSAIIILLSILAPGAAAASGPILVGHRGSSFGVENTGATFANGALRGYQYLETDFKLSGDSVLLCTHDNDLSRLGASGEIASLPADSLCNRWLSQSRLGVDYGSYLCRAEDYIAICRRLGAKPLIELKWTDGINSRDCSNIPILIDLITRTGVRDSCIILTSMKPCLEYIRRNYPDINLQFLTGKHWADHFDWCVENRIDVDIQAGCFDSTTVKKFHDAGLKVNVWCANTPEDFNRYASWKCDFITTDRYLPPSGSDIEEVSKVIGAKLPMNAGPGMVWTQFLDKGSHILYVMNVNPAAMGLTMAQLRSEFLNTPPENASSLISPTISEVGRRLKRPVKVAFVLPSGEVFTFNAPD